jgi:hypothetical protein
MDDMTLWQREAWSPFCPRRVYPSGFFLLAMSMARLRLFCPSFGLRRIGRSWYSWSEKRQVRNRPSGVTLSLLHCAQK